MTAAPHLFADQDKQARFERAWPATESVVDQIPPLTAAAARRLVGQGFRPMRKHQRNAA